jgi:hypothetical protein
MSHSLVHRARSKPTRALRSTETVRAARMGPRGGLLRPVAGPTDQFSPVMSPNRPGPPSEGAVLWWSWFGWVTVGACAGFALAAVVAVAAGHAPAPVLTLSLLLAGAVEGAALGWAQAHVLRRVLPRLPLGRWVSVTSATTVLAWFVGLVPATFGERTVPPVTAWPPLAVLGGVVLLTAVGAAQWTVLRRHLPLAGGWIWGTAVAWIGALGACTAVTMPLWAPGQSTPVAAAVGVLGGVLMAATMAAVTGAVLLHLLPARHR